MDKPASDGSSAAREADPDFFLPDLCGARTLFPLVLAAELFALVIVLARPPGLRGFFEEFALVSLFLLWLSLASGAVLCAGRGWLARLPATVATGIAYGLILATAALTTLAAFWVLSAGGAATPLVGLGLAELMLRTLGIVAVLAFLVLRYFHLQHRWRAQTRAEARARLELLKARIRPHFLFNGLNTIASLTRINPERAERAIEDLADLFRAAIADRRDTAPLADELALARQYMAIEQLRLGQRLRLSWDLPERLPPATLPVLTLQPLLENAVGHGIERRVGGGEVTIRVRGEEGRVTVSIENARPRVAERDQRGRVGTGQALGNIRGRLDALYGGRASLRVDDSDEERFLVTLTLPMTAENAAP